MQLLFLTFKDTVSRLKKRNYYLCNLPVYESRYFQYGDDKVILHIFEIGLLLATFKCLAFRVE